ncbi:hypothetical protein OHAE_2700 [Ochrobactrum soli]|uniref:Uncharacterized protein n=1 Tax=Ochrobactrum soli TaxID=2448455 RepID=A0A2P9HF87_9HYPH|nr:hypothetical protein OHAE_2700 [[Ochrobactrum] soli]
MATKFAPLTGFLTAFATPSKRAFVGLRSQMQNRYMRVI